jgi:glycosyltransferase involved in cell wall biosynthesis
LKTTTSPKWTIVVVGQSPALASGQAKMIGYLLGHQYPNTSMRYVPMNFSARLDEMGKPSVRKVLHLFQVIFSLWYATIALRFHGIRPVLYFPPAGPHFAPVLRDIVLLGLTRRLFARTIFHFHAAGLGEFRRHVPIILRPFFDWAYRGADITVATAASGLKDGESLDANTNLVVYNGISELPTHIVRSRERRPATVRILFVGMLSEDKGVLFLLGALQLLKGSGMNFEARLVGNFQSVELQNRALALVRATNLDRQVVFEGELHGDSLFQAYADADIFCFPSFFAAESFGLVCVEAMRASLPVVATNWRGIPEVVEHGQTGFIVPPRSAEPLANVLAQLINDPDMRAEFGQRGRERYLTHFTVNRFCAKMGDVFSLVTGQRSRGLDQQVAVQGINYNERHKSTLVRTAK